MKSSNGWGWRPWASNLISVHSIEAGKGRRFSLLKERCVQRGGVNCTELVPENTLALGKTNALIIGDSHSVDAFNAFAHTFPGHNFVISTFTGCPPHINISKIAAPTHPYLRDCHKINLQRHDPAYLRQFDYLVVNVRFGWYLHENLRTYLSFLKTAGIKKVIVLGGYLSTSADFPDLINKHGFSRRTLEKHILPPSGEQTLKAAVRELDFLFMSKLERFCDIEGCALYDVNRIPFTYDKHHLSYEFSVELLAYKRDAILSYLEKPN